MATDAASTIACLVACGVSLTAVAANYTEQRRWHRARMAELADVRRVLQNARAELREIKGEPHLHVVRTESSELGNLLFLGRPKLPGKP